MKLFKILSLYLTPDLFHHLNVMLFKLGYSPLINNEWGLTVCLVKSSASNVSALLKGVVDEGGKNLLHKHTSLTFKPAVLSKCLLMPPLICSPSLLYQWINQSAQILWSGKKNICSSKNSSYLWIQMNSTHHTLCKWVLYNLQAKTKKHSFPRGSLQNQRGRA